MLVVCANCHNQFDPTRQGAQGFGFAKCKNFCCVRCASEYQENAENREAEKMAIIRKQQEELEKQTKIMQQQAARERAEAQKVYEFRYAIAEQEALRIGFKSADEASFWLKLAEAETLTEAYEYKKKRDKQDAVDYRNEKLAEYLKWKTFLTSVSEEGKKACIKLNKFSFFKNYEFAFISGPLLGLILTIVLRNVAKSFFLGTLHWNCFFTLIIFVCSVWFLENLILAITKHRNLVKNGKIIRKDLNPEASIPFSPGYRYRYRIDGEHIHVYFSSMLFCLIVFVFFVARHYLALEFGIGWSFLYSTGACLVVGLLLGLTKWFGIPNSMCRKEDEAIGKVFYPVSSDFMNYLNGKITINKIDEYIKFYKERDTVTPPWK